MLAVFPYILFLIRKYYIPTARLLWSRAAGARTLFFTLIYLPVFFITIYTFRWVGVFYGYIYFSVIPNVYIPTAHLLWVSGRGRARVRFNVYMRWGYIVFGLGKITIYCRSVRGPPPGGGASHCNHGCSSWGGPSVARISSIVVTSTGPPSRFGSRLPAA